MEIDRPEALFRVGFNVTYEVGLELLTSKADIVFNGRTCTLEQLTFLGAECSVWLVEKGKP